MIATLLVLTNTLIDFLREHFIQSENSGDLSVIDLIDDSLNNNNSITESMVIFSNCEHFKFSSFDFILNSDNNNNNNYCWPSKHVNWQKRHVCRMNRVGTGLTSHKKMECDAEASRVSLSGTAMSPRKTPISPRGILTSPESDCNSNNLNLTNDISMFGIEKTHDSHELFQDNAEYQWFLDYGCKDNAHHQSVFSVLNSHDLLYYDDLARDLDANLAEVDMDDFHRADIHSVLSTLPNMCNSDMQGVEEREMFASVSESMMIKFGLDCSSPHSSQQEENSNSMSMCKSELLFSPVRESFVPNSNLSVDSLDLSENDINLLITCQANKNNYTIAFEGSTVMGSDDSECPESGENVENSEETQTVKCDQHCQTGKHNFTSNINNSMTRSDSVYTTWSKIKQRSNEHLQLRRLASGNNNPAAEGRNDGRTATAVKSLSLPNLFRQRQKQRLSMSISSRFSSEMNSPVENEQHCIKLYDIQKSNNSDSCDHSTVSGGDDTHNRPHNLNLVKLFIKQKSASHEGMCNYASESPSHGSYYETCKFSSHQNNVENSMKKDCTCRLSCNNVQPVKTLRNNWTQENRKNLHECSLSGFEDSLVTRNAQKNERIQLKENSDSESVEQITESFTTSEQLNSTAIEQSSHKNQQRVKSACAFNVNNNNSVMDNNKSKYCSDESTQENGSNTESTENIVCNCRKIIQNRKKMNVLEKSIQTSKLTETGIKEVKVPAYILYPNYSLPDLEFLKEKHYVQNIDFTKIFLRPQTFKESEKETPKRRNKISGKRPFSVNDIETLKRTGFKHVRDWDSLTFLLPKEYKEFLQDIPEIVDQLKDTNNVRDDLKPLFSLNAPSKKVKKRPISCDSNFFTTDCRSSNYSSTATQPSSGYRGSSTMLNSNNSNATPSPRNPSSGFRYECNDSVFNSRKNNQRSSSLLNSAVSDDPQSRPPLPRSILRNHSLDNTKYTYKMQKDNANKRYSMIEFTEKNLELSDNKVNRRRSTQDPYYLKSPQKNYREVKSGIDPNRGRDMNEEDENYMSFKSSSLESDMRRLEELLEISAVFGESIESFTENDMNKLRSQVSRFLTMQKNLQRVSDCLQTVNENQLSIGNKIEEDDFFKEKRLMEVKHSQTPNNTPEHKKKGNITIDEGYENDLDASCMKCSGEDCQNPDHWPECQKDELTGKDEGLRGLKKTVSFAEKISSLGKEKDMKLKDLTPPNSPIVTPSQPTHKYQPKALKLVDVPISEESYEGSPTDSPKKSSETTSFLQSKKDLILDVKNAVEKMINRSKTDDEKKQEDLSNLCLHYLCPSLYAILSDGLKEEIDTPFGALRNSVWSVIEASSQQGPLTEPLNHLVLRLNRDDILTEGLVKFNAFIFGLLNVNSLDAWFSYLRTRDGLLHKHYNNRGLLLLSNSGGAPIRILMDQLIHIIQPLSRIKFGMDLLYQAKLLHCSLQNLNCLLETTDNDFLSPTKQLMLLKLVQSIQNSISQPSEGKRSRQPSEELERLFDETKEKNQSQKLNKPRPRSGCDILYSENASDVAGCVKKRWSGVQLNSKLLQAFERLGEETESEYSDSLDNARGNRGNQSPSVRTALKRLQNSDDTIDEITQTLNDTDSSDINTKEKKKNILSNLNKKTISRLENVKTEVEDFDNSSGKNRNGGHKFKRLQQKWEKLSGKSNSDYSSGQSTPCQRMSPAHRSRLPTPKHTTPEKPTCDSNLTLTSPTTRVSRIPRPVISPQTTPTSDKQSGIPKKVSSSTVSSNSNFHEKTNVKSNINTLKTDMKPKLSTPSRVSRVDEAVDPQSEPIRGRPVRPSSLPYRGVSTTPTKKNASNRASSMSLNRKPEKKTQSNPKFVRTLSHRLPSDSGHLSFNEGEKLKVVLEVDDIWLLCCRGTQKGLVPKSAVIAVPDHMRY